MLTKIGRSVHNTNVYFSLNIQLYWDLYRVYFTKLYYVHVYFELRELTILLYIFRVHITQLYKGN